MWIWSIKFLKSPSAVLVCEDRHSFLLKFQCNQYMNKNLAIACIALFYSLAMFVAWIAKCDAIACVQDQKRQNRVLGAYPLILWVLTTALAITAIICK